MAATVHRIVNLRVLCVVPVIGFSFLCLLALSAFGGTVQVPLKDGWRFVKADDPAAGTNLTLGAMSDILDRASRGDASSAPVFGWAQAIVRANRGAVGVLRLTASSDGLNPCTAEIAITDY